MVNAQAHLGCGWIVSLRDMKPCPATGIVYKSYEPYEWEEYMYNEMKLYGVAFPLIEDYEDGDYFVGVLIEDDDILNVCQMKDDIEDRAKKVGKFVLYDNYEEPSFRTVAECWEY